MAKKLSRVSILDEETQSYTTAAYLIAQLGKNYSLPKENEFLEIFYWDLHWKPYPVSNIP